MQRKSWKPAVMMGLLALGGVGCGGEELSPESFDVDEQSLVAPQTGAIVKLRNACGGLVLDVDNYSTRDGASIIQWSSHAGTNQQFKLTSAGEGGFTLTSVLSGKRLDVLGGRTTAGTQVIQWSANGGNNQRWLFKANSDGSYRISPAHAPSLALKIAGNSSQGGALAEVNKTDSSCGQRWTLVSVLSATPVPAPSTPAPAPSTPAPPLATALPIGDLPGWKQTLAEDFSTNAGAGSAFATTYSKSWCGYVDNSKYKQRNISASGGNMVVTLDGLTGAAGVWAPNGCATAYTGTTYGRYAFRFKAVNGKGNGTAVMVWPVSDRWGDGEIDYPEGNLDGDIHVFHHGVGCTDCSASDGTNTGAKFTDWHVAAIEWVPGKVTYFLDDKVVKTVTHDIPTTPHRYTMQVAPTSSSAQTGQYLIDWVAIYQRN